MTERIWPAGAVAFPVLPGETGAVTSLRAIWAAISRAAATVANQAGPMMTAAEAMSNLVAKWSQPREVYVAGLEARYYVRGGLDSRYRDPEARDALVRDLMRGKELPPPCLLTHEERALVAAAFLWGWTEGQGKDVDECLCWMTDPSTWFTYYGATEPGSQWEWNPDCPVHRPDPVIP